MYILYIQEKQKFKGHKNFAAKSLVLIQKKMRNDQSNNYLAKLKIIQVLKKEIIHFLALLDTKIIIV